MRIVVLFASYLVVAHAYTNWIELHYNLTRDWIEKIRALHSPRPSPATKPTSSHTRPPTLDPKKVSKVPSPKPTSILSRATTKQVSRQLSSTTRKTPLSRSPRPSPKPRTTKTTTTKPKITVEISISPFPPTVTTRPASTLSTLTVPLTESLLTTPQQILNSSKFEECRGMNCTLRNLVDVSQEARLLWAGVGALMVVAVLAVYYCASRANMLPKPPSFSPPRPPYETESDRDYERIS